MLCWCFSCSSYIFYSGHSFKEGFQSGTSCFPKKKEKFQKQLMIIKAYVAYGTLILILLVKTSVIPKSNSMGGEIHYTWYKYEKKYIF